MAQDIFINIEGIKGESQDSKHKDEIEVLSFSWGASQQGTMSRGGGGGAGKVDYQDFTFMHNYDKASPNLMSYCSLGKHIPKAKVTFRKAGGKQEEYLVIDFKDLLVSNVSQSGASGAGSDISESVSLNFSWVNLEYKPQKADGSLDAGVKWGYDLKKNEKV